VPLMVSVTTPTFCAPPCSVTLLVVSMASVAVSLSVMVLLFTLWRGTRSFRPSIYPANIALMTVGLLLCGYQLTGYLISR